MNDDNLRDETQPVRPAGAAPAPDHAPAPSAVATEGPSTQPPTTRRGFRERFRTGRGSRDGGRTFGLAALIASALAGVIVGGLGFAAVDAATGDDRGPGRDGWVQRGRPWPGRSRWHARRTPRRTR